MRVGEALARQSSAFYGGEGDAWYDRNKDAVLNPIVVRELTSLNVQPKRIIEMGCSHGRYLHEMYKHYGPNCHYVGYDPSAAAVFNGKLLYPHLDLRMGANRAFYGLPTDMLVFGFCLYLMDRDDLFAIVADSDWCLSVGGHIIVHDFDPEYPHRVPYHHREGLWSFKMDYSTLWTANPSYRLLSKTSTQDGQAISIIRKEGWRSLNKR